MASTNGIAVTKEGDKFSWRIGTALWEFRQWPEQRMWRNGECLSFAALGCGLKLYPEAVIWSLGYEHGTKRQEYNSLEDCLEY